jgi:hypothetical protein
MGKKGSITKGQMQFNTKPAQRRRFQPNRASIMQQQVLDDCKPQPGTEFRPI